MAQLVGCKCVRCGERIGSVLDGRFCAGCGGAVHNRCAQSETGMGCPVCGAAVAPSPPSDKPAAAPPPLKNPTVAFTLNFVLPGAGLWYLGSWGWGVVNLLAVLAIGLIAALALPENVFDRNIGILAAACNGGSGGLAMALTKQRNERGQRTSQPRGSEAK